MPILKTLHRNVEGFFFALFLGINKMNYFLAE
jgi:hypothetical protein